MTLDDFYSLGDFILIGLDLITWDLGLAYLDLP